MLILNKDLNSLLGKYQLSAVAYFQSSKAVNLSPEKESEMISKELIMN